MLPPIFFSTFAVFCLVILCKGRVSLGLLSRSNNLETQKCLWTLTSSRAAGDSDFTEGKRLFWTWTDQNSSFTTIPITLISMAPYSSFICPGTLALEGGSWYQRHGRWGGHSSTSHIFARLLLPLQGSDTSATCPFFKRKAGYKPTQSTWQQSDPVLNVWQRKKTTLLSPSLLVVEVTLSQPLSPTRKHHTSKPGPWQAAKCTFSTFCNISWLTHLHNGTPPLRKRFWLPRSIYSQRWRELPFSPLTK